MKKKLGLITATVALGALLAVGGTLAWFTDTETATNVVTTGNVQVAIQENGTEMEPGGGIEFEGPQTPGQTLDKAVAIINKGANDAYVRVQITNDADLNLTFSNSSNWTLYSGYYYYTKVLSADTTTDTLLSTIGIPSTWDNSYTDKELDVVINVEAIQSDNLFVENETVTAASLAAKFNGNAIIDYVTPSNATPTDAE